MEPKPAGEFCTICDTPLDILLVDGMPNHCCLACSRTGRGYLLHEKELVLEIRDILGKEHYWQTYSFLMLFRHEFRARDMG